MRKTLAEEYEELGETVEDFKKEVRKWLFGNRSVEFILFCVSVLVTITGISLFVLER